MLRKLRGPYVPSLSADVSWVLDRTGQSGEVLLRLRSEQLAGFLLCDPHFFVG